MNLVSTTTALARDACYFLQCFPWDGYEGQGPTKAVVFFCVVEGKEEENPWSELD